MPEDNSSSVPPPEERMRMVAEQLGVTVEEAEALADEGAELLAKAVWRLRHPDEELPS